MTLVHGDKPRALERECAELKSKNAYLQQNYAEARDNQNVLQERLAAAREEIEQLRKELEIMTASRDGFLLESEKQKRMKHVAETDRDSWHRAFNVHKMAANETIIELEENLAKERAEKEEYKYSMEIADSQRIDMRIERDAAITERERLEKVHDMDALIMSGLRRVLATSRMALNGNTTPLELALAEYDKNKLPVDTSDAEERLQNTIITQLQRGHKVHCDIIESERDAALAKAQAMQEALEFYAASTNWTRVVEGHDLKWASNLKIEDCALLNCGGGRARLVLAKWRGK